MNDDNGIENNGTTINESRRLDILIVDRKKEANLLQLQIQRLKHRVTILESYKEALGKIIKTDFDLIIVDMNLARGNGIDLIKQIRKSRGSLNVIAMTHDSCRELEKDAREQRVIYYTIKPFDIAELQSILNHILKKKIIAQQ